jgi:DNA-binding LytR/AlgR family response regulator
MEVFNPLMAFRQPVTSFLPVSHEDDSKAEVMDRHIMRTLIVDDEPIARRVLREELESFPDVEVIGEAENGKEALNQIAKLKPDLVFLDLQIPLMDGFEVVRNLRGAPLPVIVIVTAFDQHAIQAFEAGAIDYLLKPVSEARLRKSVQRAKALYGKPQAVAESLAKIASAPEESSAAKVNKIVGRSGAEYFLLDSTEVLAFQAEGELVWIITTKNRFLATQTLRTIEERLKGLPFQRVHRNAIVNVNHVRKMAAISSQRWLLTLSNQQELIVSKRQAHNVREILRW